MTNFPENSAFEDALPTVGTADKVLGGDPPASIINRILGSILNRTRWLKDALGTKADLVNGKIPTDQLPALAIKDVFPVANQAEMLALDAQRGDSAVWTTTPRKHFILKIEPATVLANWIELDAATEGVASWNGRLGTVGPIAGDYAVADITGLSTALAAKESGLGAPGTDGWVLTSTAAKVRTWRQLGQADITGLTAALVAKAAQADLTTLQGVVAGKALQTDMTALQGVVAGKALQVDMTALQGVVAGKSANGHGHAMGDVTGLVGALGGKADLSGASFTGPVLAQGNLVLTGHGRVIADCNSAEAMVSGCYGFNNVPANGPGPAYLAMIVCSNIDVGLQIAGGYNTDNLMFRGWWGSGSFSTWRILIHSGNIGTQSVALAASVPWGGVSDKPITFPPDPHTHFLLKNSAVITNATPPSGVPFGLSWNTIYGVGFPTDLGNVLTLSGHGKNQLFAGWPGNDGGEGSLYIRAARDMGTDIWGPWRKIWTDGELSRDIATALEINAFNIGKPSIGNAFFGFYNITRPIVIPLGFQGSVVTCSGAPTTLRKVSIFLGTHGIQVIDSLGDFIFQPGSCNATYSGNGRVDNPLSVPVGKYLIFSFGDGDVDATFASICVGIKANYA